MQCIQYLEDEAHPMRRQSPAAIKTLLDYLVDFKRPDTAGEMQRLTHAECLQIVNLAPTTLVEMVVVSLASAPLAPASD